MADRLSPAQFADKYLKLPVYIFPPEGNGPDNSTLAPPGWQEVRVANYRLGANAYRSALWADVSAHVGPQLKVRVQTISGTHVEETLTKQELSRHFQQPFMGKGSPEQVQVAIQTLYRFHKAHVSLQAFLAADFVGLDCNGFVGNYYQRVIQDVRWRQQNNDLDPGPTTLMSDLLAMTGSAGQVTNLEQIESGKIYVLVMADSRTGAVTDPVRGVANSYGHVMLTEPNTLAPGFDGAITVCASEATAAGKRELRSNVVYTISRPRKTPHGTVFRVERGSPTDVLDVRIAEFKTS